MTRETRIAIVLPAYDPGDAMLPFALELRAALPEQVQMLVVDDGSAPERGREVFPVLEKTSGISVLHHDRNRGKGAALKTAFRHLLAQYADEPGFAGCITADCDGQHSVPDILEAVRRFLDGPDALLLGVRTFRQKEGDVPWKSRLGNLCTLFLFNRLLKIPLSDTQTGLRAIPCALMKQCLDIRGDRFEFETEMLLTAGMSGVPIREYPIRTIYFDRNSGTHFHPVRDAFRIYAVIFRFLFARFFRFTVSAFSSAVLDIAVFSLLFYVLIPETWSVRFSDQTFSLRILLSCIIARIVSSLWNFHLNRGFVFGRRGGGKKAVGADLVKYYLLAAGILTASWMLTELVSLRVPAKYLSLSKLLIDSVLFLVSYVVQRHIVFRSRT